MIEDKNIPHILDQARPSLSDDQKQALWHRVEAQLSPAQPVLSPFSIISYNTKKIMAPLALLLAVILTGGATAYASDAAKPGDILYPVEQLVESVQLGLTFSPEAKEALVESLTEERIEELKAIIDEEVSISPSNADSATSSDLHKVLPLNDLKIKARVFTDTTVVKLELGDKKFYFETDAQTEDAVLNEVLARFPILSELFADSSTGRQFLTFQIAGRKSRPNDRGIVHLSKQGEERIATAVDALLTFLDKTEINPDLKDVALTAVSDQVDGVHTEVEAVREDDTLRISGDHDAVVVTIDDEGNSVVEVTSPDAHVKVEDHAGQVTIEKENHNREDVDVSEHASSTQKVTEDEDKEHDKKDKNEDDVDEPHHNTDEDNDSLHSDDDHEKGDEHKRHTSNDQDKEDKQEDYDLFENSSVLSNTVVEDHREQEHSKDKEDKEDDEDGENDD